MQVAESMQSFGRGSQYLKVKIALFYQRGINLIPTCSKTLIIDPISLKKTYFALTLKKEGYENQYGSPKEGF